VEIQLVHFVPSPFPQSPPLDLACQKHQARRSSRAVLCILSTLLSASVMCLSPAIRRRTAPTCRRCRSCFLCADALVRLLHFNQASTAAPKAEDEVYKVLVLDKYTKDILAPLLRLNDLRKHGITLHLVRTHAPSPLQQWSRSLQTRRQSRHGCGEHRCPNIEESNERLVP